MNKTILLASMVVVGLISVSGQAAITLRASKSPVAVPVDITSYLSDNNEALQQALKIHNLMNEMPLLRDTAKTASQMKDQHKILKDMQKRLHECNVQKMGKMFKNPSEAWGNMMNAYTQKRQTSQATIDAAQKDVLDMSFTEQNKQKRLGWDLNREIMLDVYQNPEKWGDIKEGGAFPLWKDQIVLFEKQWNAFYNQLNTSLGAPVKGRPAIDEETRHNFNKYDIVLAAHRIYLNEIKSRHKGNNADILAQNPPRAPKALPPWNQIVQIDSVTGKMYPEQPEPWKQMAKNKTENFDGEKAQFQVSAQVASAQKSELEQEYDMLITSETMFKGVEGAFNTQGKMEYPLIEKLKKAGIDTVDFDVSKGSDYARVMKLLKEKKNTYIQQALIYIDQLERQDQENPQIVVNRQKLNKNKKARLSAKAQEVLGDINGLTQMSPATQQRLLVSALEKDENATVYLTQTNAIDVDQLMREQKATRKIITESYDMVAQSVDKTNEMLPQMVRCSI